VHFRVKAIQGLSAPVSLTIEAPSALAARDHAERAGYDVLAVRHLWPMASATFGKSRRIDIVELSEELIALIDAGLTLVEAIEILANRASIEAQRSALERVVEELRAGAQFSAALQSQRTAFPPLFVAAVRASEGTGTLTDALKRYIEYERQLEQARSRIVSASIYPALLLTIGGFVVLFLLAYVVPRFSRLYQEVSAELPWGSRVLMEFGRLVDGNAALLLGAFVALIVAGYIALRSAARNNALLHYFQRIPGIQERARVFELARLYRTLSLLLRSGVSMLPAIEQSKEVVSAPTGIALEGASAAIREGRALSHAFETKGLTTEIALRMLAVAERTGALPEMLERIAAFHERELGRWLERATRLFEPVLMTIIGLLIGIIVVLMYMPIFDLAGSIG